jgi:hypothetical protein
MANKALCSIRRWLASHWLNGSVSCANKMSRSSADKPSSSTTGALKARSSEGTGSLSMLTKV